MDIEKLNVLSEKIVNDKFTESELAEFRVLLEQWNEIVESTPTSLLF
ncbi:MAG: hypothetical protein ACJAXJ_003543 [Colwellia sp.]|jgi:hypothetical protein